MAFTLNKILHTFRYERKLVYELETNGNVRNRNCGD